MFGMDIANNPEFKRGRHKNYQSESRVDTTSNNRQFNRTARRPTRQIYGLSYSVGSEALRLTCQLALASKLR